MLVFEDLLHPGPNIVAAAISSDRGLLFGPALDLTDDGAKAWVVLNRVVKFGLRITNALGGFGFLDPPKQFGVADGVSVDIGFHGLKRKLGLVDEHAGRAAGRDDLADGGSEGL